MLELGLIFAHRMITLDRFALSSLNAFLTDLKVLVKIRLSISVVFSAVAGYLLAASPFSLYNLFSALQQHSSDSSLLSHCPVVIYY